MYFEHIFLIFIKYNKLLIWLFFMSIYFDFDFFYSLALNICCILATLM